MTDGRGWGKTFENEPQDAEPDETTRADFSSKTCPEEKPCPAEWCTCEDDEGGAGK